MYGFNRMRNTPLESDPNVFHPWQPQPTLQFLQKRGVAATRYSQSTPAQLVQGRSRLVFASFTPIEKGFLGCCPEAFRTSVTRETVRALTGVTAVRAVAAYLRDGAMGALGELLRITRNTGRARVALEQIYLGYGRAHLEYLTSEQYDYWEEFRREYDYVVRDDHVLGRGVVHSYRNGRCFQENVEGRYQIVREANQLEKIIEGETTDVAMVLTIEGGHTISLGPDNHVVSFETMVDRIRYFREMPHPLFFITLAHHFDNGLCGHARSVPGIGQIVMDQGPRMYEGFETRKALGMRVARELLDLDEELNDRGGRRILIDVKHMSPRSRRQFYDEVILPHNQRTKTSSQVWKKLPIVASHVAYSGVKTIDELIANEKRENDQWIINGYSGWGLNLADEDIRIINDSEGLIGLILDRRVLGVEQGLSPTPERWRTLFGVNVLGVVDAIANDPSQTSEQKRSIWDRICIGSDFDGAVTPVPLYATVTEWDLLADDLRDVLRENRSTRGIDAIGIEELVEKICWRNAYDFARKHLPRS
ncbi:MAG: hypothetical protein A2289_18480 [Deltaproteobacteria bacterium RIFOXYA12_FULL_58_15]|nr:MAG: hypothetical protein A2289_18480 [Deltaproteobacteria bacterium RIFOXYA12_FULL_58_15]OGR10596.1 MAG: hypothetical protein A2341_09610 [Deltaproteobacteria bacterium RIFOXYB12_FULL_58_9]